jgi:hypothetical protein
MERRELIAIVGGAALAVPPGITIPSSLLVEADELIE